MLWWSGRQIAHVSPSKDGSARVHMDVRKMWQTKDVRAASIKQGKVYAERWCAARLYPELRLREAVARIVDSTPTEPPPPMPSLPPTPEQRQQARRLNEAGTKELERVKEALEPRRPKPRQGDPMTVWWGRGATRWIAQSESRSSRKLATEPLRCKGLHVHAPEME